MITIRPVNRLDIPVLEGLCSQLGYPASESEIRHRLEDLLTLRDHCLLAAVSDSGKVVGWVHGFIRRLLIAPTHIELGGLVVDHSQRNQGIGQKLLSAIEDWAVDQDIDRVYVRSNAIREDAHRFYQRLGYRKIKTSLTFIKDVGA